MRKIINIAALLLLLVGFPLGSYLYMKQGFDYRKRAVEAQGDFGKMPNLNALGNLYGDLPDSLRGNMTVVGWLDQEQTESASVYGNTLDSLYQQFQDSPHLFFTTITSGDSAYVADWLSSHNLPLADPMLSVLQTDKDGLRSTGRDFKLPTAPGTEPLVAMVDSSLTIRKYYDLSEREQTIGLVQLISLIIPLPEKGDVVLDPKKEL